jgi:hypothetical protein
LVHNAEKAIAEETDDGFSKPESGLASPMDDGESTSIGVVQETPGGSKPPKRGSKRSAALARLSSDATKDGKNGTSVDPLSLLHSLNDSDDDDEPPMDPLTQLSSSGPHEATKFGDILRSAGFHGGEDSMDADSELSRKRKKKDTPLTAASVLAEIRSSGCEFKASVARKVRDYTGWVWTAPYRGLCDSSLWMMPQSF